MRKTLYNNLIYPGVEGVLKLGWLEVGREEREEEEGRVDEEGCCR
jgi:hypothetical protein